MLFHGAGLIELVTLLFPALVSVVYLPPASLPLFSDNLLNISHYLAGCRMHVCLFCVLSLLPLLVFRYIRVQKTYERMSPNSQHNLKRKDKDLW